MKIVRQIRAFRGIFLFISKLDLGLTSGILAKCRISMHTREEKKASLTVLF